MPKVSAILVSQMIDDIKVEGRIKGADNLDITCLALINELLLAHTETERYSKFVKVGVAITLVAATGFYDLPDDFQNIRTVYWWRDGQQVESRTLRQKNDFVERSRDGTEPKYYEIVGDQISVFPSDGILITDNLTIDYWGEPDALVPSDTFPIAKLYPVIKREVISRIHLLNKDFNSSDRMAQGADTQDRGSQTSEDNGDTE